MLEPLEPAAGRPLPFGWRWIIRSLLLRRWPAISVLLLTGAIFAAGLVFPICTQRAVDAIVAGRAGLELGLVALAALLSVALEAGLYYLRQQHIIQLGTFIDRRISRRAFAHVLRLRIDGVGFSSGDVTNHFKQAEKIRDFVLYEIPRTVFDLGGAAVALAMSFYYDVWVGSALLLSGPVLVLAVGKQFHDADALIKSYYSSIGVRQNALAETVNGIGTVKALALESARMRRWEATTSDMLAKFQALRQQGRAIMLRTQIASRGVALLVLTVRTSAWVTATVS